MLKEIVTTWVKKSMTLATAHKKFYFRISKQPNGNSCHLDCIIFLN